MAALILVVSYLIAMIVPFLVVPLVSLFTTPPEPELLSRAFSVNVFRK